MKTTGREENIFESIGGYIYPAESSLVGTLNAETRALFSLKGAEK